MLHERADHKSNNAEIEESLFAIFARFSESSTSHGLPRIFTSKSYFWKVNWLLIFLTFTGLCCWQVWMVFVTFFDYPVAVAISIKQDTDVQFPSVTICNLNALMKQKLHGTRFEDLKEISDDSEAYAWRPKPPQNNNTNNTEGTGNLNGLPPDGGSFVSGGGSTPANSNGPGGGPLSGNSGDPPTGNGSGPPTGNGSGPPSGNGSGPSSGNGGGPPSGNGGGPPSGNGGGPPSGNGGGPPSGNGESPSPGSSQLQQDTQHQQQATQPSQQRQETQQQTAEQQATYSMEPSPSPALAPTPATTPATTTTTPPPPAPASTPTTSTVTAATTAPPSPSPPPPSETPPAPPATNPSRRKRQPGPPPPTPDPRRPQLTPDPQSPESMYQNNIRKQISSDNDYWGLLRASQLSDLTDISSLLTPTIQEINNYGYQYKEFILQCSFNQEECNESHFRAIPNRKHGLCYTFNWGPEGSIRTTTQYGVQSGLKLTLDPNDGQYVGLFSPEVGVRVLVHRPFITPYPEELGVVAGRGKATSISMKQKKIMKLPSPYGNCTNDRPSSYSVMNCTKECLYDKIAAACGCEDRMVESDWNKTCSFVNATQTDCVRKIYAQYHAKNITCDDCKELCQETTYVIQTSTSDWPSSNYMNILMLKESYRNKTTTNATWLANKVYSDDVRPENFVRVNIFFQEFSYEYIEESKGYPFERLMSDIGGTMGLYVGISFCTFYELVELLVSMAVILRKRCSAPPNNVINVKPHRP